MVATRFLVLIGALSMAAPVALSATVKTVSAKKKSVVITLDDGEIYEKGASICFFSASGKKIDCGTVAKIKGSQASVKLKSRTKMKRIKVGSPAHPEEGATGVGDGAEASPDGEAAASPAKTSPFRVWASYSPALATPAKFNKLGYAAPTVDAPDTLWKSDAAVASALFGFNLQVGIPMGSFALIPGLRFRTYTPSLIDADYIPQKENPYVSTEEKASALGLWVDFQFFRMPMLSQSALWLASGIDVDSSTVTLTSTKKDDSGKIPQSELGKATSKLTVASLRFSSGFDFVFAKPFGAFFGLTMMVPLAEFGSAFSGSLGDDEARGQADPGEDLKKSIGHTKNSLAYEVSIGTMLAF